MLFIRTAKLQLMANFWKFPVTKNYRVGRIERFSALLTRRTAAALARREVVAALAKFRHSVAPFVERGAIENLLHCIAENIAKHHWRMVAKSQIAIVIDCNSAFCEVGGAARKLYPAIVFGIEDAHRRTNA
jgi:hypothetical protein